MKSSERYKLIKRNTLEILTEDELKVLLAEKKDLSAYYGTATTGPVHIGYFIPLSKVFDFTKAKVRTTILIADIHGAMDDLKTKWEELDLKAKYYEKCIELAFPWTDKPKFVLGSTYQLDRDYVLDMLKVSTIATARRAKRAASEVTRMKNPKVSELIYPIMQALDEQYLGVDIQLGGIDQRHIMAFARELLPELGYKKRVEIMTPLVASLQGPGTKMSASEPMTHIKVYDSEESIRTKVKKAYCPEGVIEDNPILQIAQFLIFPINNKMRIEREGKYGDSIEFNSYKELETAFVNKELHPMDLKESMIEYLIEVFRNVRNYFASNQDLLRELGEVYLK